MFLKSRRNFLKDTFLTTAVIVMSNKELYGAVSVLGTISLIQQDLFPQTKNIPTLKDVNAVEYLSTVLRSTHISDANKEFIRNGVQWINEEAVSIYKKSYVHLSSDERQSVLKSISTQRWGESWIETILTYIFEAMLSDPIYGVNKNEAGWKWLKHSCGEPRPTKALV